MFIPRLTLQPEKGGVQESPHWYPFLLPSITFHKRLTPSRSSNVPYSWNIVKITLKHMSSQITPTASQQLSSNVPNTSNPSIYAPGSTIINVAGDHYTNITNNIDYGNVSEGKLVTVPLTNSSLISVCF